MIRPCYILWTPSVKMSYLRSSSICRALPARARSAASPLYILSNIKVTIEVEVAGLPILINIYPRHGDRCGGCRRLWMTLMAGQRTWSFGANDVEMRLEAVTYEWCPRRLVRLKIEKLIIRVRTPFISHHRAPDPIRIGRGYELPCCECLLGS